MTYDHKIAQFFYQCIDHIAVGVPDTKQGIQWISELTGSTPRIDDPEPNQWYWSAALNLGIRKLKLSNKKH